MKPIPREFIQLVRNFLFSLGGEAMQSGFHFTLTLVLIRLLTPYDFGILAIAFILGGISLSYGNALISIPAMICIPRLMSSGAVNYLDVVFGTVALVISAGIAIIVAAGLWFTVGQAAEALTGGAFIGLWTLRNHVRAVMFARRAMAVITLSDFSYSTSGIILVVGLLWLRPDASQVAGVLWALAAANLVAIYVALRSLNRWPRISFRRDVWQRYRAIRSDITWSLFSSTTSNIQGQALMFLVAAIGGPAAYAPIAAGAVLFSPLRPAVSAIINVFRTDFVTTLAEGRLRREPVPEICTGR